MSRETFTHDVFLSYSSKDKMVVRALAEQLRGDGLRVWFDEWEIRPGESIPAKIEDGLDRSYVLVLCMSANALGSEWSQLESGMFRFRDPLNTNRRFIPLRLDDAPIKGSLGQLRYIDWRSEERGKEYAKLVEACRVEVVPSPIDSDLRDNDQVARAESKMQLPRCSLPPRNERFVGRKQELTAIHQTLNRHIPVGIVRQIAAHGIGGLGKTSIAIEYAWEYLQHYPGGAFFVSCSNGIVAALAQLADPLGLIPPDRVQEIVNLSDSISEDKVPINVRKEATQELARAAILVKKHLESGNVALVILDNVNDANDWISEEWVKFLPAGACRRLITTRLNRLPGVDMLCIERFPNKYGRELLARHRPDATQEANIGVAGDIVEWFDGLAVGLTIVGVYMSLHPCVSWGKYAESLADKGLGTVRVTEQIVGHLPDYGKRVEAVFAELLVSLTLVQSRALEHASRFPQDKVSPAMLMVLLENDDELTIPECPGFDRPAQAVIMHLRALDLLRPRGNEDDLLSLHRVLREYLRNRLNLSGRPSARVNRVSGATGIIKTKTDKGFGFIAVEGSADVFFHNSCCNGTFDSLVVGQAVSFDMQIGEKGPKADNVVAA